MCAVCTTKLLFLLEVDATTNCENASGPRKVPTHVAVDNEALPPEEGTSKVYDSSTPKSNATLLFLTEISKLDNASLASGKHQ